MADRAATGARTATSTPKPGESPAGPKPTSAPADPATAQAQQALQQQQEQQEQQTGAPVVEIDRDLQERIFIALCANVDVADMFAPTNDPAGKHKTIKQTFQHLRGLSEVAAHEFRTGNGQ